MHIATAGLSMPVCSFRLYAGICCCKLQHTDCVSVVSVLMSGAVSSVQVCMIIAPCVERNEIVARISIVCWHVPSINGTVLSCIGQYTRLISQSMWLMRKLVCSCSSCMHTAVCVAVAVKCVCSYQINCAFAAGPTCTHMCM